jgi:iron complex outermembrane receptor protein
VLRSHFSRGVSTLAFYAAVFCGAPEPLHAQTVEELPSLDVTAQGQGRTKSAVPQNVPAVIESVTASQIEAQVNAITTAETLKYLPSIEVRERYIGDRNAIVSTRTTGTVSSAESLVYADGLLLSNLLGNSYSYPPRWQMVTQQEVERVDVIYGPFSALYPGNSMGGIVTLTTRMPEKLEIHAALKGFLENFSLYGTSQNNPGVNGSVSVGNRINDVSFWLDFNHLDAHAHPMSFSTASSTTSTKGTPAVGNYSDIDPTGLPRQIFGAYSIDHTIQDTGNFKIAYDIVPAIRASYVAGLWRGLSDASIQTYLTDLSGNPVYNTANGAISVYGQNFKLSGLNPSHADAFHLMQGLEVRSDTHGAFDFDAVISSYNFLRDLSLLANNFGVTNTGQNTSLGGTGWKTADLRGIWRPDHAIWGNHEVSFGGHFDEYELKQYVYGTPYWASSFSTSFAGSSLGNTQTEGLYIQDVWALLPQWTLTLGGRGEFWQAFNGSNTNSKGTLAYPDRSATTFSPKGALSYQATPDLLIRLSLGEAYRFPTVNELFQQLTNSQNIIINNPALRPEQDMSYDLTTEYRFGSSLARISLFHEDRWDALFSQTNTTVVPNVTSVQNIGKVCFNGVETAFESKDVWVAGLDLSATVTLTGSRILSDFQNPLVVGGNWPRIPTWRARAVATYRPDDRLTLSAGLRYASGAYSLLNNSDFNHNVYGGISSYLVADARINYRLDQQWTVAAGIDNIGNYKYYVSPHPYPQRTFFAELRYDY